MKFIVSAITLLLFAGYAGAQSVTGSDSSNRAITTAVPFLTITPDARHAGVGDAGAASSADPSASYWNPAKLVRIDKTSGGSMSYTPWLGKIVNDMNIFYLSGFYKLNREEAVAASLKYFDMGEIFFRDAANNPLGDFNPRDWALDVTYSRMLTESFSVGLSGRYISSNLTGVFSNNGVDAKPGRSAAVDVGVFYSSPIVSSRIANLNLAAVITNIGGKISYSDDNNKSFLPTNLRLGSALTTELDPYNSFTFLLDFNKLLVPTPTATSQDKSMLSGMFGSFTDAPGGFQEEMQEITTSIGVEYWYNAVFAGRIGYFNEAKEKGNRKYLTLGLGFRKDRFGFDMAYLVPTNGRESALAETIRFTILLQIAEVETEPQESVTDQ
jgi:hypothetical protein